MINFRYHVVSLTAVFLALAIGLVVGTAALNGPAAEQLSDEVSAMRKQNDNLRDQVNHLEEEAQQEERFAAEAMPWLIGDRLAGRRILLVTTSDADKDYVDDVVKDLEAARVKITGQVTVLKKFVDPANKDELLDIADLSKPANLPALPSNSNGVETSAALLAAVLVDREPTVSSGDRTKALAAYREFLILTPDVSGSAQAVLLLTGAPYSDKDAAKLNGALKVLVEQFDKAGPLVLAGSGTGGDGNLLGAVRGDGALNKSMSTVDNVASPQGRVVTLLALVQQLEGKVGHYGVAGGSNGLIPKPAGANGS